MAKREPHYDWWCLNCSRAFRVHDFGGYYLARRRGAQRTVLCGAEDRNGHAVECLVIPLFKPLEQPYPRTRVEPWGVGIGHVYEGQENEANFRSLTRGKGRSAIATVVDVALPTERARTILDLVDRPKPGEGGEEGWLLCRDAYPCAYDTVRSTTDIVEAINFVAPKAPRRRRRKA
jgi:hypothetical protein